jgi:hypothetical protein
MANEKKRSGPDSRFARSPTATREQKEPKFQKARRAESP